jgi:hypothetical protein
LTNNEQHALQTIQHQIGRLKGLLNQNSCPELDTPLTAWHDFLTAMKETAGHASNDMHIIASLMAKDYLSRKLVMRPLTTVHILRCFI